MSIVRIALAESKYSRTFLESYPMKSRLGGNPRMNHPVEAKQGFVEVRQNQSLAIAVSEINRPEH